jgi:hypothetical protein
MLETNEFPKICDICEKEMSSLKDIRKHLKTHSYFGKYHDHKEDNFKCLDCDFTSKTIETMEVHVGKFNTTHF